MRATAGGVCLRDISVPGIGCHALLEVNVMATAFKHLSAILCVFLGGAALINCKLSTLNTLMLLDKIHGSLDRLHKIWVWKFYVKVSFEKDSVTRLNQGATCISY